VTVRGTIGIEPALFGIPVITAGTGGYDRRGFTTDSTSREEYLRRLATLASSPRLSPEQTELAERYAYGTFFGRPLTLVGASLEYARDGGATPTIKIRCQSREGMARGSGHPAPPGMARGTGTSRTCWACRDRIRGVARTARLGTASGR
jgi:hypothetical protein